MNKNLADFARPPTIGDWAYLDGLGIWRIGVYNSSSDFGGTDCPYSFRRVGEDFGRLDMCSGQRLKVAFRIEGETQLARALNLLGTIT